MIPFFTRTALIFMLMTLGMQTAFAQDDNQPDIEEGAGFFSIGTSGINIGDLNNRLEAAGYPTFDRALLAIGGGGYGIIADHFMLGGNGYGLFSSGKAYQGRSVSLGGGYGLVSFGYLLRPTTRLRVYPMLGIGGGGLNLRIGSTGEADSFDEVLQDPGRQATVGQGSLLIGLSAGMEYYVAGHTRIGLRVGYLMAPYTTSWNLDENTLANSPTASLAGPFVRLLILP